MFLGNLATTTIAMMYMFVVVTLLGSVKLQNTFCFWHQNFAVPYRHLRLPALPLRTMSCYSNKLDSLPNVRFRNPEASCEQFLLATCPLSYATEL